MIIRLAFENVPRNQIFLSENLASPNAGFYFVIMSKTPDQQLTKIRALVVFFIIALVLSGVTAFPVQTELEWLSRHPNLAPAFAHDWLMNVLHALQDTNARYPFIAYGFDWLAFAHIVIASAFIGVWIDPVRNIFIVHWAMFACVAVFPLALIAGPIRQIPFYHQVIDCCFGLFGLVPLVILKRMILKLELVKPAGKEG
jgi:hypothetical protein